MSKSDNNIISEILSVQPVCSVRTKYTDNNVNQISVSTVENILKNKFINANDMNAIVCLFDTLFIGPNAQFPNSENGIFNLSSNFVNEWIIKMKKLNVSSVQGYVYISDILSENIQVIIKVPQKKNKYQDLIREYFLGIMVLNKLRYHVPTIVYTLGAFFCPQITQNKKLCEGNQKDKTAFVIYEKIEGNGVDNMLKNNSINFNQFLGIFIQLLLTLEVAQRECNFTHFDLHTGNVMLRHSPGFEYNVPIGTSLYKVHTNDYVPIIIDFGYASAYVNGKSFGEQNLEDYGIMPYMVQGADMYKFLVFSGYNCTNSITKNLIIKLFNFYGQDDPYRICTGYPALRKARDDFATSVTFSKSGTYTPHMFLKWILNHNEFGPISQEYMIETYRDIYYPIKYSNMIKEYDQIFNETRNNAMVISKNCLELTPSYILCKYNIKVLTKYNEDLQNNVLTSFIRTLYQSIQIPRIKEKMIQFDIRRLNKYIHIYYPTQNLIDNAMEEILRKRVNIYVPERPPVLKIFKTFIDDIQHYLQFLYTIKELKLNDETLYLNWINRFTSSEQYNIYLNNSINFDRMLRWEKTLEENNKFNNQQ